VQTDTAAGTSRPRRGRSIDWGMVLIRAAPLVLAMGAALLIGAVLLLLMGVNPLEAYASIITGVFGSKFGLAQSIIKATPLLLVGLGICIAFRASVINIGGEGQIILGDSDHGLPGRRSLGVRARHSQGAHGGQ
jgi:hypothetical protein